MYLHGELKLLYSAKLLIISKLFPALILIVIVPKLLARLFDVTVDQVPNYEVELPGEVTLEDKQEFERIKLTNQLDEDDRSTVFKIIDTLLTKKKFKDFFQKNVAAL